ncbi:hypothetical protein EXN65_21030 [Clostridium botulinum]|uniref:Phage protein n=3 Tax=Clostridium botulinum TaxID=1491 RepID=A5I2H5_CLOBH|nr:hypothetical protein [Clostridium botulinum]ACQ51900.1 hypothetical protein CLJ_B1793 [Clostridium botulinum Ba4 str. 657]ACQ53043.1 hypothetical protein CLJ_B1883 [Clostridium botulinum Ba4 str. 657]ACQ53441.1 hypothetical protein CLJ_B1375 [Clostridium botulinum Ba4 str. 657]AJE09785.1 hypothetical protein T259_1739 [Clostridium botulinum CDC_1436]AJE10986.1 hypothetical protein T259_1915 [Clostridium botulinum CDC_1436]
MLEQKYIPYLIELVKQDKKEIISAYINNDKIPQSKMAERVREKIINDLKELYFK